MIYQDFPELEQTLQFFELLWVHCWGTIKQFETENYKVFIDTTYILYLDFINEFPLNPEQTLEVTCEAVQGSDGKMYWATQDPQAVAKFVSGK